MGVRLHGYRLIVFKGDANPSLAFDLLLQDELFLSEYLLLRTFLVIFEFQVKRMNVEIPFILDALQASETIEVQVQ